MKYIGLTLAANAVAIVFATGAIVMAINGIDGWGWMIFGALLTTAHVKWETSKEEQP